MLESARENRRRRMTDQEHAADSVFVAKSQKGYLARTALRDAAMALIAEKGVDGFSVGALCARAGLKRTSFYTYYQTMEDLLDEVSLQEDANYDAAVEAAFGDLPPGTRRFAFTILHFFRLAEAEEDAVWNRCAIELLVAHPPTWERSTGSVRENLETAINAGEMDLSLDDLDSYVDLVFAVLIGLKSRLRQGRLEKGTGPRTMSLLLRAGGVEEKTVKALLREWVDRFPAAGPPA